MSHTLPSVPGGLDSVYFQERPGNPQDTQKPLCLQGAREKRLQPNLEKAGSAPEGGGRSGTGGRRRSSDDPAPRLTDAALSPPPPGFAPPQPGPSPPPPRPPASLGPRSPGRGQCRHSPAATGSRPPPAPPSSPAPPSPPAPPPSCLRSALQSDARRGTEGRGCGRSGGDGGTGGRGVDGRDAGRGGRDDQQVGARARSGTAAARASPGLGLADGHLCRPRGLRLARGPDTRRPSPRRERPSWSC